jgi:hypothetical protein
MNFLIGSKHHFQEFRLTAPERAELLRMRNTNDLRIFYEFIINRINEFEISIIEDSFKCESINEILGFNHLICLLRKDIVEHCSVKISSGLATKMVKIFLSALKECCVSDGVVELDVKDVLTRFQSSIHHSDVEKRA